MTEVTFIRIECKTCYGKGIRIGAYDHSYACDKCDGKGHVDWEPEKLFLERLELFLGNVRAEVMRARKKFPGRRVMGIALAEEFGELMKASLDEHSSGVMREAVQTACMCARFAIEGDESLDGWRKAKGLDEVKL